ncbi:MULTISPECIES: metallophosphoesterase [unclassified Mesorhizobium]|uniref:metallophosphoesterase family protein n=1 Tax=unclassified Mesorhizobium TaxID=325217 RepID=UPI00333DBE07
MRLAVLSDIHGNLRALEAVHARIKDNSPDIIVNLGDCLSGPLWPKKPRNI